VSGQVRVAFTIHVIEAVFRGSPVMQEFRSDPFFPSDHEWVADTI